MYFIGDVHGLYKRYFKIIKDLPESIQVGDFGMGFGKDVNPWNSDHKFIRGNHDSPAICREHSNYLGDYGVTKDGIFFVGGAYTIDYKWRETHNYSHPNAQVWWEDEEIVMSEFLKILELFEKENPEIVVAHDIPEFVKEYIIDGNALDKRRYINRTSDGLMPEMIKVHKPKIWIFGHYHTSTDVVIDDVRYVGLNKLEVFEYKNE